MFNGMLHVENDDICVVQWGSKQAILWLEVLDSKAWRYHHLSTPVTQFGCTSVHWRTNWEAQLNLSSIWDWSQLEFIHSSK